MTSRLLARPRHGRAALLLGVLVLAFGLVACGGSTTKGAPTKTAAQQLATAQKYLADAKGVTISLSTPKLPKGVQGILKASGLGTKSPAAFKGKISVVQSGLSINVPVIAVDGDTYIQFGGSWQKIDPAKFGAPDPASLFAADSGLTGLLSDVTGAKKGKKTRDGKEVLETITGKVAGDKVASVIPSAGSSDFDATYTLDEKDHLQTLKLTGPFYPDADDVSYTIGFSKYGTTESIKAP